MKYSTFLFFIVVAYPGIAQFGGLDTSFGNKGKVVTEFTDFSTNCTASVKTDDDKIIVSGIASTNEIDAFYVSKYLKDGTLDISFGDSGISVINSGFDFQAANAVAVQQDGKIVVAGNVVSGMFNTYWQVALVRFNVDGSPDGTFGHNGVVISDVAYKDDFAYAIAIQNDGNILITGNNQNQFFLTARYTPQGQIDSSFGTNGYVITAISGLASASTIQIQPDNKIITGGSSNGLIALVRYLRDGDLDSSFGVNGIIKTNFPSATESIQHITLQNNGSILAVGTEGSLQSQYMFVVRYKPDGILDSSFGTNGKTTFSAIGFNSKGQSISITKSDKIVAFGTAVKRDIGQLDLLLAQLRNDGNVDTAFGDDGITVTDFGFNNETAAGGFLTNDDKPLIAGRAINPGNNPPFTNNEVVLLARYNSDSIVEKNKYVRIKRWLHRHGFTWEDCPKSICNNLQYYAVQRSTNGSAFTEIARIFNRGNNQQQSFKDLSPANGTNNYRVAAVSSNNSVVYSNIIAIDNNSTNIKVYPNPVKNSLQVEGLPATQKTKLRITDLNGNTRMTATASTTTYAWNVALLPKGNYVLHVQTGGAVISRKFLKE